MLLIFLIDLFKDNHFCRHIKYSWFWPISHTNLKTIFSTVLHIHTLLGVLCFKNLLYILPKEVYCTLNWNITHIFHIDNFKEEKQQSIHYSCCLLIYKTWCTKPHNCLFVHLLLRDCQQITFVTLNRSYIKSKDPNR